MEEFMAESKNVIYVSGINPSTLKKIMEELPDVELIDVGENVVDTAVKRISLDTTDKYNLKLQSMSELVDQKYKLVRNELNYRELRKQSMNSNKFSLNYSKGLRK